MKNPGIDTEPEKCWGKILISSSKRYAARMGKVLEIIAKERQRNLNNADPNPEVDAD